MNSGIYCIENLSNKKIYIGSTINFYDREYAHFWHLENGTHPNNHLQSAYKKYGKEQFKFDILEYVMDHNLLIREQYYLDVILEAQEFIRKEKSVFKKIGYNLAPIAGRPSLPEYTEEYLKYLSDRSIALWNNTDYRAKQMATRTPDSYNRRKSKRQQTILNNLDDYLSKQRETRRKTREFDPIAFEEKWKAVNGCLKKKKAAGEKIRNLWKTDEYRNNVLKGKENVDCSEVMKKTWSNPKHRETLVKALGSPKTVKKRVETRRNTMSKEGYINPAWKIVVAVDRATNGIKEEFIKLKEANDWASKYLGTIVRVDYYIKNNHKDYCGLKWLYKKDYQK